MVWTPAPETIQILRTAGAGDMGDLDTVTDQRARFSYPDRTTRWCPVFLRAKFVGSGETATLSMYLHAAASGAYATAGDPDTGAMYDTWLHEWAGAGQAAPVNWRLMPGDHLGFVFEPDDQLVFEWADGGTNYWSLTLGVAPFPNYEP